MDIYDVVVLGAGPAGLSIASELSFKRKVLVIEQNKEISTTKAWTTEVEILKKAGLDKYITGKFSKSYIQSFEKNKFYINDTGGTVNEQKVLEHFANIIKNNGSKIEFNTKFIRAEHKNKEMTITTNKKKIFSKLIIDCSGVNSKLAKKHQIFEKYYYCTIYGEILSNIRLKSSDVCLFELMNKDIPHQYFELFPYSKKKYITYTFIYNKKNKSPQELKNIHQKNKKEWNKNTSKAKIEKELYGVVPLGIIKTNSADNIFFFGDTGLIGAPTIASGFTNIIQHYKRYAKHLENCLKNNKLKQKDLEFDFSEHEKLNRNLLYIIGLIFMEGSSKQMNKLVKILKLLPNKILIDMIFLKITLKDIQNLIIKLVEHYGLEELVQMLPKKEYLFICEEAAKIMEEISMEEAHLILNNHVADQYKKGLLSTKYKQLPL